MRIRCELGTESKDYGETETYLISYSATCCANSKAHKTAKVVLWIHKVCAVDDDGTVEGLTLPACVFEARGDAW